MPLLYCQVIAKEGITTTKDGLEAIIFTADGDMRQALNNLQVRLSTTIKRGWAAQTTISWLTTPQKPSAAQSLCPVGYVVLQLPQLLAAGPCAVWCLG